MTENKILAKNTLMMYILLFSTYILGFITIPYQARILGPEVFGVVGLATAVMVFYQLFIDFGFLLYATAEVSTHREKITKINKIFSSVTISKILLSIFSLLILLISTIFFENIRDYWSLYLMFLLATIAITLLPDYLYLGMERMTPITVRTVAVRLFFTIMIFVFLNSPDDYLVIPTLLLIGNSIALIIVYRDVMKRFGVKFVNVNKASVKLMIYKSSHFFYSRIASAIYGAGNTILLGALYPGATVGYYVAADKLITTSKNAMSPIADSVYPHMIKRKDYHLIKKILLFTMPFIITACIIAFIFAEQICTLIFGTEFVGVAPILRVMLPIVIFTLPSYLLGFPTLGAMGLSKHANNSIIFAALAQLLMILILAISGNITVLTLAATTTIAELMVLIYRAIVVYINKNKMMAT
jgi:PST family polysaccharide transporter